MPDWSIKIIPNPSATADRPALLIPDLVDAQAGRSAARRRRTISSAGTTRRASRISRGRLTTAKPAAVRASLRLRLRLRFRCPTPAGYLSDMIPGNLSSSPAYNVVMPATGSVVHYCLIDANGNPTKVRGQIIVSAIPTALNVPGIGS